ncbi:protein IQ-DOMAIN 31 isoform X1 [Beta vulgaris subsp. vulgaris]|uniref:protein IQ-DOMAIN 31 isoform X1 n=2 Tax=Beta vulgaris subsp. vulgaris TaxID=3555 RepID=UPI00203713E9|nr:protein IQ-DOMAIN 31 isoform X1 [Beta vulgaris subsp. vulgaris]XP_048500197.1 protein IQ-DOMAIN 31 isoform X1 [Beta vulgaris subsp. vulgaris]
MAGVAHYRFWGFVNSPVHSTMGKSPGKWIKTVFFGKKTSKSNFAKGKEKSTNEKEVNVRVTSPEIDNDVNPPEVSNGALNAVHVDDHNLRSEYKESSLSQPDEEIPISGDQLTDAKQTKEMDMLTDAERIEQEKAITKAQAAFRGYLARRAFKALKGIIRLQALIRGHLVRRQAVSTLYCIVGIVKLQALVRGSKIRCSDSGLEVQKICISKPPVTFLKDGKIGVFGDGVSAGVTSLSVNAFTRKLLAPSPAVMPLRVQYDVTDPNSVQKWLERWSISCPWKPVSPPKKVTNSRVQKKQVNSPAIDGETGRPKRSVRKVPSLFDNVSAQSTSEVEKPRRNPKKVVSHPADSAQENPQHELEKVKRSLRKVHTPVTESSGQPQTEVIEKSTHGQEKATVSNVQEVSAPNEVNLVENTKVETSITVKEETIIFSNPIEEETTKEPLETKKSVEFSDDDGTMVKTESFENDEKDENTPVANGALESKEDAMLNESQKSSRRASFPAKQELMEDGLQNTPKLPSYMQATQSAKAKLRAQGSPKISQDEAEKNNQTRRHSLPSAPNGKVNSASPRIQKPLQGSGGKGGNKSDKSLLSSRDGSGKGSQAQWRR